MKDTPLVSIITVSLNSAKTIRRTIESVLAQTYTKLEYWIIDGASTDGTVAIAEEYRDAFKEKGIEFHIISEPDSGMYEAMNKGIAAARGTIVGIINSDDWYDEEAVGTMVKAYEEKGFDYFVANLCVIKENGKSVIKKSRNAGLVTSRHWNHPTAFVTKQTYDELGAFRLIGLHDDFDFYLRVKRANKKIVTEQKVLAYFTIGGLSHSLSLKSSMARCKDKYRCYRDNGYSRAYIIECVLTELSKYVLRII